MGLRDPKLSWFLTYPQSDIPTMADLLDHLQLVDAVADYLLAEEKHKDGNVHYHVYVKYQNGVKLSDAPNVFTLPDKKRGDYQPCRSAKAVIKYCTKDNNYISSFDVSAYLNKKKKLSVSTIQSKSAKQALVDGDIQINSIRNYNLARSILCDPYEHTTVRGLWVWGPPGTGKSHAVREAYPDLYLKAQNKWFDGYDGQKAILLDDLDTPILGHYLKIWADKYACSGELKGAHCQLQHEVFAVTSNYHPEELFLNKEGLPDSTLIEAICRRFRIVHKTEQQQSIFDDPDSVPNTSLVPGFTRPEEIEYIN